MESAVQFNFTPGAIVNKSLSIHNQLRELKEAREQRREEEVQRRQQETKEDIDEIKQMLDDLKREQLTAPTIR